MAYPKEVYEKAWTILESRKEHARQTLEAHQQEARRAVPEIGEIQRKMVQTAAGITKSVVTSPGRAGELVEQLAEENLALQHRREELLMEAGFPRDFLVKTFTCPRCEDTGYIGIQRCECFETLLKQEAFALLSEMTDNEEMRFSQFSLDYYSASPTPEQVVPRSHMSEIFEFCKVYAQNFSLDAPSLLMMGKTGLGKTHLSLSIAWEVTKKGFGVVYTPMQRLMDKLEADKFSYDQEAKDRYSQNIQSVTQCDLLVLDDLGTEFPTSFTKSVLYNMVNTRLVEGRPTIVNTNLEFQELEAAYSQRMASRLIYEYKILRFFGQDVRALRREHRYRQGRG